MERTLIRVLNKKDSCKGCIFRGCCNEKLRDRFPCKTKMDRPCIWKLKPKAKK